MHIRNRLMVVFSIKTKLLLFLLALRIKVASVIVFNLLVQVDIFEFILDTFFDLLFELLSTVHMTD